MAQLRTIVKTLLPIPIRRFLRTIHRNFTFQRSMKRFIQDPYSCKRSNNSLLRDLIYGWGNEEFSAHEEYLAACIEKAEATSGPILECGSGITTILIGAIAKKQGRIYWALENSQEWATKVLKIIKSYNLDTVVLCVNPLKDYGDYCWYNPPIEAMPDRFSMIICDGPPGETTKGGRYGLVPIMKERLPRDCIILLDDAFRAQEMAIAQSWAEDIGAAYSLLGSAKPYIEMRIIGQE